MSEYITRSIYFEAAHLLQGYKGRCGSLHGHSYKLEVTISCNNRVENDFGFIMDFKQLDAIIRDFVPDHCFITNINNDETTVDAKISKIIQDNGMRIFKMKEAPSAENMVKVFSEQLQEILNDKYGINKYVIYELKLWETKNSFASWRKED